ncbi:MBL fold metallo-hydrolase [Bacillaceae bacterium Marseille-Q3522]|nr:MBL fold metallo-hydrolase [Bacillaceae bacterium Marseille-Q3522]
MIIQLIRNATLIMKINGKKILLDPMLGKQGSIKSIPFTANKEKNPTVPLPLPLEELTNVDAVMITHKHVDHFDEEAKRVLPKQIPVFCSPKDEKIIRQAGFFSVTAITDFLFWEGIKISRVKGRHGSGLTGLIMGNVSGFIVENDQKKLYIAGDTIYTNEVRNIIINNKPDVIVANTGEARMIIGKPITMAKEEIVKIAKDAKDSKIIAVHLEAVNHCTLSRDELNRYLKENDVSNQVAVPYDGEVLTF